MEQIDITQPWDRETFLAQLRTIGINRYHHKHPFHRYMNSGQLSREQVRGWVANRFYYQQHIPIKDAAIISNCPVREVRRLWLHRISDHDGFHEGTGGIQAWLTLPDATQLTRQELLQELHVLPRVRFSADAYANCARTTPCTTAI